VRHLLNALVLGLFLLFAGSGCSDSKTEKKEDQGVIPPRPPAPLNPVPPGAAPVR
jgi:hypothetical protein